MASKVRRVGRQSPESSWPVSSFSGGLVDQGFELRRGGWGPKINFNIKRRFSVPAERLFSVAGHVMRKARNRLNSDSARAQICVKEWVESSFVRHMRKKMSGHKKNSN